MNADRWPRVKEIFHDALERAPAERSRFVAEACGGDAALQAEVERLLAAHDQAGSFIEQSPVAGTGENPKPAAGRCLTTGQVRGHYEILRLIGVGGMGEVYAARDLELGRTVALKVVTGDNADAQKALRREAQHASRLNHPHICTIHEVGEADGQCYIVMEYVDGQRLSDLIFGGSERTRPTYEPPGLPIEMMLRYGIQIADALAHAHRNGVIHRDLKSANVVITPDGRAKVLDFGLARRLPAARLTELSQSQDSLTAEGVVSGTLSYMAPELLRGEQADARSDIWALGVLLYEMAAGARPFAGVTGFELSAAILHDPPAPLPARIPASLKDIIGRCLAKDPRERYKQADEVRSALETAQARVAGDAVPIPAVPIPTVGRMRRLLNPLNPFRSRRAAWIWGVFLALNVLHLLWHATRQDPVAVGASGRPAIAVLNFTNAGNAENQDTAWLSSGVPSMLLTDLAQTEGLEIVSPQRLSDAARQMGEKSVDSLDKHRARTLRAAPAPVPSCWEAFSEWEIRSGSTPSLKISPPAASWPPKAFGARMCSRWSTSSRRGSATARDSAARRVFAASQRFHPPRSRRSGCMRSAPRPLPTSDMGKRKNRWKRPWRSIPRSRMRTCASRSST
jgi:hypothetical protein